MSSNSTSYDLGLNETCTSSSPSPVQTTLAMQTPNVSKPSAIPQSSPGMRASHSSYLN